MASPDNLSLAFVAGEASGDLLASRMLSALRPQLPDALMHGIGGAKMAEYGFISDYPMEKLSVRGLFEVLRHYREIKGIQVALRDALLKERPSVFVGIDAPDFNLGLERQLKAAGIPTVHFVSPSIWAWRAGRIKKIGESVNRMLLLFPFEEAIYRKAGIPATYVGHPLAEVIAMEPDVTAARNSLGLKQEAPVVAVLPGSRMSELKYHAAVFAGAVKLLAQRDRSIQFVTPIVNDAQRQYFDALLKQAGLQDIPLQIIEGQSHAAMAAADTVLVASGTAALEVALHKKPMVVAYKLHWATYQIVKRMITSPWCSLPNILSQETVVPEILQDQATPQSLADAIWQQLTDENLRISLRQRFIDMHHSLLRNTAHESAQAVLDVMRKR
ncbi:MAG: lipid-A-disaccharide synthase [Oxalobacter sp.]|nr:MAG: lipid-A-disaccharide synthase [Oxalobacter sp.]